MSLWKYECPVCQRLVTVKKDGTMRAHGYRTNYGYGNTNYCEGTGQPYLKEDHDQGQTRPQSPGSASAAAGPSCRQGNAEAAEDQGSASGHHRPGEEPDQQGAVMEHGTDQPPSQGDYRRDDTPPLHGPFDSVAPTEKQHALIVRARQAYDLLRLDIKASTKTGRYQSLAITALEESAMWLNKAITHDG